MLNRGLPTTLILAAGLVAGVAWWASRGAAPPPAPVLAAPAVPGAAAPPGVAVTSPAAQESSTAPAPTPAAARPDPAGPPPGMTPVQWSALAQELSTRPGAAAELARVRDYLVWSDAVARWRQAPGDAALATQVRDGLPDRLARREVSVPEARALLAALLPALEPDAQRQAQALQAFEQALPAPSVPDPRQQAFQRDQAAAVAAWRRAPEAARDPAALQAELERLRRQHFAQSAVPPSAGSTPPQERSP